MDAALTLLKFPGLFLIPNSETDQQQGVRILEIIFRKVALDFTVSIRMVGTSQTYHENDNTSIHHKHAHDPFHYLRNGAIVFNKSFRVCRTSQP